MQCYGCAVGVDRVTIGCSQLPRSDSRAREVRSGRAAATVEFLFFDMLLGWVSGFQHRSESSQSLGRSRLLVAMGGPCPLETPAWVRRLRFQMQSDPAVHLFRIDMGRKYIAALPWTPA